MHCGLVTPYGNINPGQRWFRKLLLAWWHQAIWTTVDFPFVRFCGIHLRVLFPLLFTWTICSTKVELPVIWYTLMLFWCDCNEHDSTEVLTLACRSRCSANFMVLMVIYNPIITFHQVSVLIWHHTFSMANVTLRWSTTIITVMILTSQWHYNGISFIQNIHNRNPIACLWGWGMGVYCEFNFKLMFCLVTAVLYGTSCYIEPIYGSTWLYNVTVAVWMIKYHFNALRLSKMVLILSITFHNGFSLMKMHFKEMNFNSSFT